MNIQNTIEQALASAGLDTRSGPMHGVTETIRQALASAGLGAGVQAPRTTVDEARTFDVEAREQGAAPARPEAGAFHRSPGQFIARRHTGPAGDRAYKLYLPPQALQMNARPLPLVVMLHGCTQSPDDFAVGTRMNQLADELGLLVVYPEQSASANPSRCWNWFRSEDQVRVGGEPEIIAGIVRTLQADHAVAPGRVYVAGLSAGAAMALVLGETHPEIFSAVGVHSGLPYGSASDIPSALAAMKGRGAQSVARAARAVPTIVFHGDRDHTVQHRNGEHIVQQAVALHAAQQTLSVHTETGVSPGGRRYRRTLHAAAGRPLVEAWTLHGAGHAWAGGDAGGSHTDPGGPDASAAMLAFFMAQTGCH